MRIVSHWMMIAMLGGLSAVYPNFGVDYSIYGSLPILKSRKYTLNIYFYRFSFSSQMPRLLRFAGNRAPECRKF